MSEGSPANFGELMGWLVAEGNSENVGELMDASCYERSLLTEELQK